MTSMPNIFPPSLLKSEIASVSDCRQVSFGRLLAEQRTYASQTRAQSKFGLMVPDAFVRGIRDIGYTSNGQAAAELVDNALQANANRVDVLFGYAGSSSKKKPTQLAVIDNGHGMDPAMIRLAVMWGGTHRENDRNGLGRYGYGLPSSSVSLGRRFTVISHVFGGDLQSVELDLDAIAAGDYTNCSGDIVVPEPRPARLPSFVADHIARAYPTGWASGTVILIEKLDRLEWATTQGMTENLSRQFGVIYHKLISEAALYIDGELVVPIDPLFLTPRFHLHSLDHDRAQAFDPVRVEVRDAETGAYKGAMVLRYAWLPPSFGSIDKTRDAVGLNANARFSIMKNYHGVIFSRNGRLIDVQTRTPWTSLINNDRYIKVEVEFSATLDEGFGVTTSKQQVTVSAGIWDLLRQAGLPKAIEQLRHKVKEMKAVRRLDSLSQQSGPTRLSEQWMNVTSAEGERATAIRYSEDCLRHSRYQVRFEHAFDQPFFRVGRRHGTRTLHLNTAHRFYEDIYDGRMGTPEMRSALEVLLFTLGDVMLEGTDVAQGRNHQQISAWSHRLNAALSILAASLSAGEGHDLDQSACLSNPA